MESCSKCHLDFETHSAIDLKKVGLYRYAEDPTTDVWLFCYRFDHGPVVEWRPGQSPPHALLEHIAGGGRVVAHNAAFERIIWNVVLRRSVDRGGWPKLKIAQMDCTMARALAIHLPGDLDQLGKVLTTGAQKDKEGHKLMMQMAKPRVNRKRGDSDTVSTSPYSIASGLHKTKPELIQWWDDPEKLDRLGLYCQQDVLTESDIDDRLPPLSDDERRLWELDQKINDRGIAIDVSTIEKIVGVLEVAQANANARMAELTNGAVSKVTGAPKLTEWLRSKGLPIASLNKQHAPFIREWVDCFGDETMSEAIELRWEVAKSSTAKYKKMLDSVCADGRIRGALRYHQAHTGRWGGQLIQPQNLPRVDEEKELPDVLGSLDIMA